MRCRGHPTTTLELSPHCHVQLPSVPGGCTHAPASLANSMDNERSKQPAILPIFTPMFSPWRPGDPTLPPVVRGERGHIRGQGGKISPLDCRSLKMENAYSCVRIHMHKRTGPDPAHAYVNLPSPRFRRTFKIKQKFPGAAKLRTKKGNKSRG